MNLNFLCVVLGEEPSIGNESQKHARTSMHRLTATEGVPMPTLYLPSQAGSHGTPQYNNGSTSSGINMTNASANENKRGRMGVIELLLYNMSSTLASVAAGYDVRLSNVMPIHPKLHPR